MTEKIKQVFLPTLLLVAGLAHADEYQAQRDAAVAVVRAHSAIVANIRLATERRVESGLSLANAAAALDGQEHGIPTDVQHELEVNSRLMKGILLYRGAKRPEKLVALAALVKAGPYVSVRVSEEELSTESLEMKALILRSMSDIETTRENLRLWRSSSIR